MTHVCRLFFPFATYVSFASSLLLPILPTFRAGWIPQAAEVPQEIVEEYNWVNGVSVTGTEILHGAYRNVNPNAAFCLRDPSFLSQLSLQDLPRYQDKGHHDLFIQSLKEQVCHRFPKEQILKYNCQVLGTDCTTGIEMVRKRYINQRYIQKEGTYEGINGTILY